MVLFVVAVGYGNRHPWYQLPFVPITAAFTGAGKRSGDGHERKLVPGMAIAVTDGHNKENHGSQPPIKEATEFFPRRYERSEERRVGKECRSERTEEREKTK